MEMLIENKADLIKFYEKFYNKTELNKEELDYIDHEAKGLDELKVVITLDDITSKIESIERIKK